MVPPTRSTPSLNPPSPRAYMKLRWATTQPATRSRTRHRTILRVNGFIRLPSSRSSAFLGLFLRILDDAGHAAPQHPHLDVGILVDPDQQLVLEVLAVRLDHFVNDPDERVVENHPVAILDRRHHLHPLLPVAAHRQEDEEDERQ